MKNCRPRGLAFSRRLPGGCLTSRPLTHQQAGNGCTRVAAWLPTVAKLLLQLYNRRKTPFKTGEKNTLHNRRKISLYKPEKNTLFGLSAIPCAFFMPLHFWTKADVFFLKTNTWRIYLAEVVERLITEDGENTAKLFPRDFCEILSEMSGLTCGETRAFPFSCTLPSFLEVNLNAMLVTLSAENLSNRPNDSTRLAAQTTFQVPAF